MRLVNCTTAAQYFHVLRRQALLLETDPLPLIVLTPKSLLRHQAVWSTPLELAEGMFLPVIDDAGAREHAAAVKRLILCSGKVCVDVLSHERRATTREVAVCRMEQLYPFPKAALTEVLARYPSLREVAWLQEEPENMGAWEFMRPRLDELVGDTRTLRYIGRARNSSPSEGSLAWHQLNQKTLASLAFELDTDATSPSVVLSKTARSFVAARH
jgi:2-oxoglutarate dehydrogenase E1 component